MIRRSDDASQADSVTVIFPMRFKDANDATIAATFLHEFAEVRFIRRDQSDAGSVGIFSGGTNQTQEAR
eukprot:2186825-Pyramimonas_sp.AAC.1